MSGYFWSFCCCFASFLSRDAVFRLKDSRVSLSAASFGVCFLLPQLGFKIRLLFGRILLVFETFRSLIWVFVFAFLSNDDLLVSVMEVPGSPSLGLSFAPVGQPLVKLFKDFEVGPLFGQTNVLRVLENIWLLQFWYCAKIRNSLKECLFLFPVCGCFRLEVSFDDNSLAYWLSRSYGWSLFFVYLLLVANGLVGRGYGWGFFYLFACGCHWAVSLPLFFAECFLYFTITWFLFSELSRV